jgi:hypothetical protein
MYLHWTDKHGSDNGVLSNNNEWEGNCCGDSVVDIPRNSDFGGRKSGGGACSVGVSGKILRVSVVFRHGLL